MHRRSIAPLVLAALAGLGGGCGDGPAGDATGEVTGDADGAASTTEAVAPATPEPTTTTTTTTRPAASSTTTTSSPDTTTVPTAPVFAFPTADAAAGWSVVNDTVMGGVSTGRLAWDDGALVFTGELSLDNNGGFASVRSPLVDPAAAAGWAERTGLAVELPWATFEPVTRFLDLRVPAGPLDPSRIVSVAFYLVDGVEAPFRLELRSVS